MNLSDKINDLFILSVSDLETNLLSHIIKLYTSP